MEKSILVLGNDNYDYYYGVHNQLEKMGVGVTTHPQIITLSNKGVSNHVYFYCRNKNLLNKYKSYFNIKYKTRELLSEVSEVYVFGDIKEDYLKTLIGAFENNKTPIKNIQL